MKPKALLFDFDGTLLASILPAYRGVCRIFRTNKLEELWPPSFLEFCEYFAPPYMDFYRQRGVTHDEATINRLYYDVMEAEVWPFFHDVPSTLQELAQLKPMMMGILSANTEERVKGRCAQAGLQRHLEMIRGGALNKTVALTQFCEEQAIAPENVWYVGDFGDDMRSAVKAGVVPIGITRGCGTDEVLRRNGARHCIIDLQDLATILTH